MKNSQYTGWLAVFMLLLAACTTESLNDTNQGETGNVVLKMTFDKPTVQLKSTEPGDESLNENKIKTIQVFFFIQNASDAQVCLYSESVGGLNLSGTGAHQQKLTVSKSNFSVGVTYDIYAVANLPADITIPNPLTLGALKALHTQTPLNGASSQPVIVMDGKTSAVVNPVILTPIVYIDMPLKRAVSKIRLTLNIASGSPVASATTATASLKSYASKGSLFNGYPYALATADYINSGTTAATPSSTFTFYSYENNWTTAPDKETYLIVNLPYDTHTGNYYRVAVNRYNDINSDGQNPSGVNVSGRLDRNRIYDVMAHIDKSGSDSENDAVVVSGNYTITNWTTYDIILRTINQHYLGISEYDIPMININTFTLNFVSDLPVSITNIKASCTQYNVDASTTQITYTSGQSQFPVFTVNQAASTITINSAIPINYVPKYMTFTVTNNQGLSLSATITQYPARYVTARFSSGNVKPIWNQDGTQNNYNLFTVNTLVPSSNGSYTLGDPTNGNIKTDSLAAGNQIVSPRFIIASQYGIYARSLYSDARNRCSDYGEDIYRSGWRMPTKAEIELINTIQDDPNSAVKKLLAGDAYWSAFKYDYYNFTNNIWISVNSSGTAYIRCVYDIYKDEQ